MLWDLIEESVVPSKSRHPQHVENAAHGGAEVASREGRSLTLHVEAEAHEDAGARRIDGLDATKSEDHPDLAAETPRA